MACTFEFLAFASRHWKHMACFFYCLRIERNAIFFSLSLSFPVCLYVWVSLSLMVTLWNLWRSTFRPLCMNLLSLLEGIAIFMINLFISCFSLRLVCLEIMDSWRVPYCIEMKLLSFLVSAPLSSFQLDLSHIGLFFELSMVWSLILILLLICLCSGSLPERDRDA